MSIVLLMLLELSPGLASVETYNSYLSKIFPAVSADQSFENLRLNDDAKLWLQDLDHKLNPEDLVSYDADFLISFDRSGSVNSIQVENLREDNFDKFKIFISKLVNLEAAPVPGSIPMDTAYSLDGSLLYISRSFEKAILENPIDHSEKIIQEIKMANSLEAKLIEPHYIDYAVRGEKLILEILGYDQRVIAETQITETHKDHQLININKLYLANKQLSLINLAFKVERAETNSPIDLSRVAANGFRGAISMPISLGIVSYGIAPAVAGLLNGVGTILNQESGVVNMVQGDIIKLISMNQETCS